MTTQEEQKKLLKKFLAEKAEKRVQEAEAAKALAGQPALVSPTKSAPIPPPAPPVVLTPAPPPARPLAAQSPVPAPPTAPAASPTAPTPAPPPVAKPASAPPPAAQPPQKPLPAEKSAGKLPATSKLVQYTFVVNGAALSCNKGSAPSNLVVVAKRPAVGGKPGANITDNVPLVNLLPFGTCKITKKACVPAPAGWEGYFRSTRVGEAPALLDGCTNQCTIGGKIKITNPGQTGMIAPLDMLPASPLTDKNWTCGLRPEGALPFAKLQAMPNITPEGDPS